MSLFASPAWLEGRLEREQWRTGTTPTPYSNLRTAYVVSSFSLSHKKIHLYFSIKEANFCHNSLFITLQEQKMGIKERSSKRRKRIFANLAANFKEAENWDLDFWQNQTPEERLSALVAIRRDVMKVEQARMRNDGAAKDES
jgi:hypothetical protein